MKNLLKTSLLVITGLCLSLSASAANSGLKAEDLKPKKPLKYNAKEPANPGLKGKPQMPSADQLKPSKPMLKPNMLKNGMNTNNPKMPTANQLKKPSKLNSKESARSNSGINTHKRVPDKLNIKEKGTIKEQRSGINTHKTRMTSANELKKNPKLNQKDN